MQEFIANNSHSPASTNSVKALKLLNSHQVDPNNKDPSNSWFSKFFNLGETGNAKSTEELDKILNRDNGSVKVNNDFKHAKYYIDIQSKFPTAQQFKLIQEYSKEKPANLDVFKAVFPKFAAGVPDNFNFKDFALKPFGQLDGGYFVLPLVVDWSKRVIAHDTDGVTKISEQYK